MLYKKDKTMKKERLNFSYEKLFQTAELYESIRKLNIDVDLINVRRFFAACKPIRGMLLYFDKEDVENGLVRIEDNRLILSDVSLTCEVVQKYTECDLKSAMVYLISCSPESYEDVKTGELNFHFIQNACMDIVRNILTQSFIKFTKDQIGKSETVWFSRGFGPGYFGMPIEEGKKMLDLLHGEQIGVCYKGEMMQPLKSTIGAIVSYQAEQPIKVSPCEYCKADNKNCIFCGEFKGK